MKPEERIYCAVDTPDLQKAIELAQELKGVVGAIKLGKEFFTANGPAGVMQILEIGHKIFLDLKYHDIPNTVAGAVRVTKELSCHMVTIHASGGSAMMKSAVEARGTAKKPLILAVTVLTSLLDDDLVSLGQKLPVKDQVLRLGMLAYKAGVDGLVASPKEISLLRASLGSDCILVVPGIRPAWSSNDDQKRIMTPYNAIEAGADYLVIGRPITQSNDPKAAAESIAEEISIGHSSKYGN